MKRNLLRINCEKFVVAGYFTVIIRKKKEDVFFCWPISLALCRTSTYYQRHVAGLNHLLCFFWSKTKCQLICCGLQSKQKNNMYVVVGMQIVEAVWKINTQHIPHSRLSLSFIGYAQSIHRSIITSYFGIFHCHVCKAIFHTELNRIVIKYG